MSSGKSPRDSELLEGALLRVKKGRLEGPYEPFRDAVLRRRRWGIRCNPSFTFGAPYNGKLRAAGDLKRSSTNRAAQVSISINLPTWYNFPSAIKSPMGIYQGGPLGFAKADNGAACEQLLLARE